MIVSDVIDYYTTPIGSTDGYQPSIFGAQSKLDSVPVYIHPDYHVTKFLELGYHTDKMVDDPDLATGITDLQSAVILFHQSSKNI